MIAPIQSLAQLRSLSLKNPKYKELAIKTAWEIGKIPLEPSFEEAMACLKELSMDEGEDAIIEEVNANRE